VSRATLINGGALVLALAASVLAAARDAPAPERAAPAEPSSRVAEARRIVSVSTVADALLLELCPPERVVAVTAFSADGRLAHRLGERETVRSLDDVEQIVSLRPDVVVTHNVAEPRRVERVRAAGVRVVDLGRLVGRETLLRDARAIGALCGSAEAGERWAVAFGRRMDAVARDIAPEDRRDAMYLTIYGDRFLGGTVGSSYHDVLVAAGLNDVAAAAHEGWPAFAIEELLRLDPELIVTKAGMADRLCAHSALARLRACDGGMIEVDPDLLDDPGPGMLEAAEVVRAAAY